MAYSTITYGGITLKALSITPTRVPATRKQKLGNKLVMNEVFAEAWDYQIVINGIIVGTAASISTARTNLLALQDVYKHSYSDGNSERDGNYIVADLTFNDDASTAAAVTNLTYTMTIIQDQYD